MLRSLYLCLWLSRQFSSWTSLDPHSLPHILLVGQRGANLWQNMFGFHERCDHHERARLPLAVNVSTQTPRGLAAFGDDLRSRLGEIGAAVTAEGAAVRSDIREVKHDLASVRARVEEFRTENMEFFESFTGSIEATQQSVDVLRVRKLRVICSPQSIVVLLYTCAV